ncbi:MAG: methyltransferase type 11 [Panacagrimonas sp.]|nr:polysaccharide deacetylase family protein [Panacagrimonas sp.]MCC2657804.1 methyltransferase type 11 [Panacagrimonas sp.]
MKGRAWTTLHRLADSRVLRLYLVCTALAIAASAVMGLSAWTVLLPLGLALALLADGIARPASGWLYPTVTHGPRDGACVALSFDDGPDPEVTPAVLDALAAHGARATFFTIGRSLSAQPLLAQRIVRDGHELGNHSWNHSRVQNLYRGRRQLIEIGRGAEAVRAVVPGDGPPLYRPPMGLQSPVMAAVARRLGLTVVAWSLHSHDTRGHDAAWIARRVLQRVKAGDIVLMHDGHDRPGSHRPDCAHALPLILDGLRRKGLRSVTVSELIARQAPSAATSWRARVWAGLIAHPLRKALAACLIAAGFFLGYFLLLHHPLRPVTWMPVTALDRWITFQPAALWIYVSLWLYVALPPGLLTDRRELRDHHVAMILLSLAGMAVFLVWPTASPVSAIDWMAYPPFGPVIDADAPGNALPSLHAAFAVFSAMALDRLLRRFGAPRWPRLLNALWASAIVYSTLATRQHVAVDAAAGALLGAVAAALLARWSAAPDHVDASARSPGNAAALPAISLAEINRRFYDPLWRDARLVAPERFNTWPLVRLLAQGAGRRLEVAPGLRPRLPVLGTQFVEISAPAVTCLRNNGADAQIGSIETLPFPDAHFDLVCALDIVEHVEDDDGALAELARVAAPGAAVLLSVPLHAAQWTAFDEFVGHRRRYEPDALRVQLRRHGLDVEQSAVYGMQPKSSWLLDVGMWFLVHRRRRAMWWYNRVFMPLGLHFQSPLEMVPGLIDQADVAEIILLCRKPCAA